MTVENLARDVGELVKIAPREQVLLTRGGKPFALVSDASTYDEEDIGYITDENFWQMIAERRKSKTRIPLAQVKARIAKRISKEARRSRQTAKTTKANGKHQK